LETQLITKKHITHEYCTLDNPGIIGINAISTGYHESFFARRKAGPVWRWKSSPGDFDKIYWIFGTIDWRRFGAALANRNSAYAHIPGRFIPVHHYDTGNT
jgi:hypothetical protein